MKLLTTTNLNSPSNKLIREFPVDNLEIDKHALLKLFNKYMKCND